MVRYLSHVSSILAAHRNIPSLPTPHDNAATHTKDPRARPSMKYIIHHKKVDRRIVKHARVTCEKRAPRQMEGVPAQQVDWRATSRQRSTNTLLASLKFPLSCMNKALETRSHETLT